MAEGLSDDNGDESAHLQSYPYPFFGCPYVTKSVLNTLDMQLVHRAITEVCQVNTKGLQLQCQNASLNLKFVIFGVAAVSFSEVSGE
jgi:hypothetical protein